MDENNVAKPIWTFCECCMTQRDHILVDKAWICSSCSTKNKNLPIFIYTPFVVPEEKSEEE
jgi:hypothetical protein